VRYLAIDLGDKRTGLAVGDDETGVSTPAGLIEIPRARRDGQDLLDALARAIDEHLGPTDAEIVLGLPLNMDGTEGPRAAIARALGDRLAERTGRRVHLFDERLTSAAADDVLAQHARAGARLTHGAKKARRDALAAAALLRGFLEARGSDGRAP
jgi:putative Holliday junction resolvase